MFPYEDSKSCLSDCPHPEKRNNPGLVNISFTLVIDSSIEKSSQVASYSMETQKFDFFFFKKVWSWILTCAKSQNHLSFIRSYTFYISNLYINGKIFTSITTWKSKNLNFFQILVACYW